MFLATLLAVNVSDHTRHGSHAKLVTLPASNISRAFVGHGNRWHKPRA